MTARAVFVARTLAVWESIYHNRLTAREIRGAYTAGHGVEAFM